MSQIPTQTDASFFGRKFSSKVDTSMMQFTYGQLIDDEEYYMKNPERGSAHIFCHKVFKTFEAPRKGATYDVRVMTAALKKLGFDVSLHSDYTKEKLFTTLEALAEEDHSKSDCLVVVMMTHGDSKSLAAYDDSYDVNKLWEPFKGDNSPSLVGKPKIFFIQACRGKLTDDGVSVQGDGENVRAFYSIPVIADILIANATFDGYAAWRDSKAGSWFIQALAKELSDNGDKLELCSLLTRVNRRVAIAYESFVPTNNDLHKKKQMPNFLSTFTRLLYFRPKN